MAQGEARDDSEHCASPVAGCWAESPSPWCACECFHCMAARAEGRSRVGRRPILPNESDAVRRAVARICKWLRDGDSSITMRQIADDIEKRDWELE